MFLHHLCFPDIVLDCNIEDDVKWWSRSLVGVELYRCKRFGICKWNDNKQQTEHLEIHHNM